VPNDKLEDLIDSVDEADEEYTTRFEDIEAFADDIMRVLIHLQSKVAELEDRINNLTTSTAPLQPNSPWWPNHWGCQTYPMPAKWYGNQ